MNQLSYGAPSLLRYQGGVRAQAGKTTIRATKTLHQRILCNYDTSKYKYTDYIFDFLPLFYVFQNKIFKIQDKEGIQSHRQPLQQCIMGINAVTSLLSLALTPHGDMTASKVHKNKKIETDEENPCLMVRPSSTTNISFYISFVCCNVNNIQKLKGTVS